MIPKIASEWTPRKCAEDCNEASAHIMLLEDTLWEIQVNTRPNRPWKGKDICDEIYWKVCQAISPRQEDTR